MSICESCHEEKQLVDAIVDGRIERICTDCVFLNRAVVIQRPSREKLERLEKTFSVRERLEETSGFKEMQRAKSMKEISEETAFPETLAYRLRKERERARLLQDKLADEIGVPFEEIMRIENGQAPSEKTLRRYEQCFKKKFPLDAGSKVDGQHEGVGESAEIKFKGEKITLKDLLGKAKTFFTSKDEEGKSAKSGQEENKQ